MQPDLIERAAQMLPRLWRAGLVSLAVVLPLGLLYYFFGEALVRSYIDGSTFGGLLPPFEAKGRSAAEYFAQTNARFYGNVVIGIPLSIAVFSLLLHVYVALFRQPVTSLALTAATRRVSAGQLATALSLYVLLTLIIFAPTLATFFSSMIGPPEDNMACLWTLEAGSRQLLAQQPLSSVGGLFFPEGTSFLFHAWSYYHVALYGLLRLWTDAVPAYNLLILHSFPLAGLSAFLLARRLALSFWLALVAGGMFAFNPAHIVRAEHHMNLSAIQYFPLLLLALIAHRQEPQVRWLLLGAGMIVLLALIDWNYLVYGLLLVAAAYLYLAVREKRVWLHHTATGWGCMVAAALAILSPLLVPMMMHAGRASGSGGHNQFVVDLVGFVTPPDSHLFGRLLSPLTGWINDSFSAWPWEHTGYLGLVAIAIVLLAWRTTRNSVVPLLLGALSFALLALGAQPHLFGILVPALTPGRIFQALPFLSHARAPSRTMVLVYLFWSLIVATALGYLVGRCKRRGTALLVGLLVTALLAADLTRQVTATTPVLLPEAYKSLPKTNGDWGILDLPPGYVPVERYMMYQMLHQIPIVQGWVSRKLSPTLIDSLPMTDLTRQQAMLTAANVRFIVLHKAYLPHDSIDDQAYRLQYDQWYEDDHQLVLVIPADSVR